jgi:hypothetical protein
MAKKKSVPKKKVAKEKARTKKGKKKNLSRKELIRWLQKSCEFQAAIVKCLEKAQKKGTASVPAPRILRYPLDSIAIGDECETDCGKGVI